MKNKILESIFLPVHPIDLTSPFYEYENRFHTSYYAPIPPGVTQICLTNSSSSYKMKPGDTMKRIIIFSDTHGNINSCVKVLESIGNVDLILHLGDTVADAEDLHACFPQIEMAYVSGNNDFFSHAPSQRVVTVDGVSLFLTHGHEFYSQEKIAKQAMKSGCMFALFGHSHVSVYRQEGSVWLLNPGSISRPRDGARSYGVIEIAPGYAKGCIIKL